MRDYLDFFYESGVKEFLSHNVEGNEDEMKKKSDIFNYLHSINTVSELKDAVMNFDDCVLKNTAKKTVFADGNPNAEIMFIGEAPGMNEDEMGIPFCGQSGKLLDAIIKSMGYSRSDVYITNAVFWRPPANRRPTPYEIELCNPFLQKHIALINPKIIIMVGSTAVDALFQNDTSMHNLRGKFMHYQNDYMAAPIPAAVIFHPSYLLRQQTKKALMWEDICFIKQSLIKAVQ